MGRSSINLASNSTHVIDVYYYQGGGGADSTALIRDAKGWAASRQLSNAALQLIIRDAGQVPGADASVAAAAPATVVPVTAAARPPAKGKGHKHGDNRD